MVNPTSINSHVRDVSFANLFWRKFAVRLVILLLISVGLFSVTQNIVINLCHQNVDSKLTETSLQLAQVMDLEIADDNLKTVVNVALSKTQESINNNPFVVDSSISLYNLSKKSLLANSFEIPVIDSEDVIEWWRNETGIENGMPKILLSEEMVDFYNEFADNVIYVEEMFYINSLLCPSRIVAKDTDGEEMGVCTAAVPSVAVPQQYDHPIQIKILGNDRQDHIYVKMSDFAVKTDSKLPTEHSDEKPVDESVSITYIESLDNKNTTMTTKTFFINDAQYQMDCGYQVNFWSGAWQYVLIFETIGILLCAVFALFNTKETMSINY